MKVNTIFLLLLLEILSPFYRQTCITILYVTLYRYKLSYQMNNIQIEKIHESTVKYELAGNFNFLCDGI